MKHRSQLARRAIAVVAGTTFAAVLATGGVASATVTVGNSTCELSGTAGNAGIDGSAADPYLVGTASELQEISDCNTAGFAYYKLTANFSLAPPVSSAPTWNDAASGGWKPIGDGGVFSGILDGNGKTLSGLMIDRLTVTYQGLFSEVEKAAIFNLTISGSVKGGAHTGGLAGHAADSSLRDITSSVEVTGKGSNTGGVVGSASDSNLDAVNGSGSVQVDNSAQVSLQYFGGIIGFSSNSSLSNLKSTGAVNGRRLVSGSTYSVVDIVGGVVGQVEIGGGIDTVSSTGQVTGDDVVGGVAGYIDDTHAANFTSSSAVTASGSYAGGLVGKLSYVSLTAGTATGSVTTSGGNHTGGIAGYMDSSASLINVKSTGAITATGTYAGGILGDGDNSSIIGATSTGAISATGEYVGGIAGYINQGSITSSTSTGAISARTYVGGVAGYLDNGVVTKSSSTGAISLTTSSGGLGPVGGIVGQIDDGSVTDSTTSGAITCGNATSNAVSCIGVGGAVGSSDWGSVTNTKSTRSVTVDSSSATAGNGSFSIGGLVGFLKRSTISGSSSTGAVSVKNGVEAGGLVGDSFSALITKSFSTGNVSVSNLDSSWQMAAGGLVGGMKSSLAIIQSSTTSNVTATGYANSVGGLVGIQWSNSTLLVTDSFARGNVSGSANVGGLIGLLDTTGNRAITLKNVYAAGTVTAPSKTKASGGGAVSSNVATISWTGSDHYFEVGDTVAVSGCSNTGLNGTALKITAVTHGANGNLSYAKTTADATGVTGCSVTGTGAKDSIAIPADNRKVSANGVLYVNGSTTVTGAVQKTAALMKVTATMTATAKANVLKTYTSAGFSSTKWAVSPTKNGGYAYLK